MHTINPTPNATHATQKLTSWPSHACGRGAQPERAVLMDEVCMLFRCAWRQLMTSHRSHRRTRLRASCCNTAALWPSCGARTTCGCPTQSTSAACSTYPSPTMCPCTGKHLQRCITTYQEHMTNPRPLGSLLFSSTAAYIMPSLLLRFGAILVQLHDGVHVEVVGELCDGGGHLQALRTCVGHLTK